jgi:methylated-DNA-protein-cysteine methyltransferase related protein
MRSRTPRESIFPRIWKVVRRIPRGRVATYGQIAEMVGMPRGARVVGYALRAEKGGVLPWQRVIGRRRRDVGHVTIKDPVGGALQRKLLEREGVKFSERGEVSLSRYGWRRGS